jgi:hypothetical protein
MGRNGFDGAKVVAITTAVTVARFVKHKFSSALLVYGGAQLVLPKFKDRRQKKRDTS